MIKFQKKDTGLRLYSKTIFSFLLTLLICSFAVIILIQYKTNVEALEMERLILESSYRINEVISKKLYKTKALAALVIKGDGVVDNFQQLAALIAADEPALANVLLAPDGIVTDVYPIEESRAVIGLNFFDDSFAGNKEAILARDTGELVMAGPFILLQGLWGLVGRYPVYIDTETEKNKFWGLVSVSLKFPEALEETGISMLEHQGFLYELWRINPDTEEQQIIASCSNRNIARNAPYVERLVKIHNAEWYFRIFPQSFWYKYPEIWFIIFAGLTISILFAFFVQNNIELKNVKNILLNSNEMLYNNSIAKELELTENKISIMLSQIQPHFLYNALSAIAQLCEEDPEKAKKTTIDFSAYLRSNMESLSDKGFISIEKELDHVKNYLNLEKAIYGDSLNVIYNIQTGGFVLPPLSIQPLVENAVKHGIGKNENGGTVTITVCEKNNEYSITVLNDGVWYDAGMIKKDERISIGIENVRRRLSMQCGGTLKVTGEKNKGTTAVVTIPKGIK